MTLKNQRNVSVSITRINIFALVISVSVLMTSAIVWYLLWGIPNLSDFEIDFLTNICNDETIGYLPAAVGLLLLALGFVAHELIHGIMWAVFAKHGFKSIRVGMLWKSFAPYCRCIEPLTLTQYSAGRLMPLFILGIIPLFLGLLLQNIWVMLWGDIFIPVASGDILLVCKLRSLPSHFKVLYNPNEPGCIVGE